MLKSAVLRNVSLLWWHLLMRKKNGHGGANTRREGVEISPVRNVSLSLVAGRQGVLKSAGLEMFLSVV